MEKNKIVVSSLMVVLAVSLMLILVNSISVQAVKSGSCQVSGTKYCGQQSPVDKCWCDAWSISAGGPADNCADIQTVCPEVIGASAGIVAQTPAAATDIPMYCDSYGSQYDIYCDDTEAKCASGYIADVSDPKCMECTTGKWKDCKSGAVQQSTTYGLKTVFVKTVYDYSDPSKTRYENLNGIEIQAPAGIKIFDGRTTKKLFVLLDKASVSGTSTIYTYVIGIFDDSTNKILSDIEFDSNTGTVMPFDVAGVSSKYSDPIFANSELTLSPLSLYKISVKIGGGMVKVYKVKTPWTSASSPELVEDDETTIELKGYPGFLSVYDGSRKWISAHIVLGHGSSATESVAAVELALGLGNYSVTHKLEWGHLKSSVDLELTAYEKEKYELILVGGPCVNSLVEELADAGKFLYKCSNWPAENFGLISVISNSWGVGNEVLVIAGTRAEDTRLAVCSLNEPHRGLDKVTASTTKVTGTCVTPSFPK